MEKFDNEEAVTEIRARCRRIETRFTRYLESKGFDTQFKKPVWVAEGGIVVVPTLSCSIKDILMVVPKDYPDDVIVKHDGKDVIEFNLVE